MINFFLPLFHQDKYQWWQVELFNEKRQLEQSFPYFGSEASVLQTARESLAYHSFRITPSDACKLDSNVMEQDISDSVAPQPLSYSPSAMSLRALTLS